MRGINLCGLLGGEEDAEVCVYRDLHAGPHSWEPGQRELIRARLQAARPAEEPRAVAA